MHDLSDSEQLLSKEWWETFSSQQRLQKHTSEEIDEDILETDEDLDESPDIQVVLEYDRSFPKNAKQKRPKRIHRDGKYYSSGSGSHPESLTSNFETNLIMQKHTFTTYMSGRLTHIEYGTFFKLPACLIIMKFSFHPFRPSSGTRFKSGLVKATFDLSKHSKFLWRVRNADRLKAEKDHRDPRNRAPPTVHMLAYAPELVYGEVSTEHRKWHWSIALPIGITIGAVAAGVEPSIGSEKVHIQGNRAVVQGSETGEASNGVVWSLEESPISEKGARGIPAIFTVACIVQHDNVPFQGDFKVDGRVGFTFDPMHWVPLTGRASPYSFTPGEDRISPGRGRLADATTGAFDKVDISGLTNFSIP
ncbi:hypothetical protein K458DRAFT_198845 [Lentithecium fluviatile CBS 122367]|uniref:Uncharacterized protein n=1 Tax=Lentithecium fluviatile CBS 122367 TaxID=1168545 RepID=A0A6G1J7H3_9PLEO|nr:hypothetical protein K458DRAFT_198845 [Lentithecium fluviatile CBS 122367]